MIALCKKFLLAFLLVTTSMPVLAMSLPRPAEIEPAIAFWTRIYTDVPVEQGLIHDTNRSLRVYAQVPVAPPGEWRTRRAQIKAALKKHRAALNALADQNGRAQTSLQMQMSKRLPADTNANAMREIAKRLRFQGGLRERFREGLVRSGRWRAHVSEVLSAHGVPAELVALPHVESSFDPRARSHAGAAGLWQFTVGTGRRFMRIDPVVDERLDPWQSTQAAAELLAYNYAQIGRWPLAITAYNHGLNGMRRAVSQLGSDDYVQIYQAYEGRRFGFASRNFYPALIAAAAVDAKADEHFPGIVFDKPRSARTIALPHFTPLETLLSSPVIDRGRLEKLNPALGPAVWDGRKFIPRGYPLRVPNALAQDWADAIAQLPGAQLYQGQRPDIRHAVATGDTLSEIAARYGVGLRTLMASNNITDAHQIRVGEMLDLPVAGAMPASVGGRQYEVRPGDTLGAIAVRHGVDQGELAELNEITNPNRLQVGQRLVIATAPAVASAEGDGESDP